jgi:hypothetical protein
MFGGPSQVPRDHRHVEVGGSERRTTEYTEGHVQSPARVQRLTLLPAARAFYTPPNIFADGSITQGQALTPVSASPTDHRPWAYSDTSASFEARTSASRC